MTVLAQLLAQPGELERANATIADIRNWVKPARCRTESMYGGIVTGFGPGGSGPVGSVPPSQPSLVEAAREILTIFERYMKAGRPTAEDAERYVYYRGILMQNPRVGRELPNPIRNGDSLNAALTTLALDRRASTLKLKDLQRSVANVLFTASEGPLPQAMELREAIAEEIVRGSNWTGLLTRAERLVTLKTELVIAHSAIDQVIAELEGSFGGNHGPLLDEHEDTLNALRSLHASLGGVLDAIDHGRFDDELGEGFIAEVARFGPRVLQAVKDDPARYVSVGLLMGLFSACGLADWGGLLAGVAANIRKRPRRH